MEAINANNASYHRVCFKCSVCATSLTMSNFVNSGGVLYCRTHLPRATPTSPAPNPTPTSQIPSKGGVIFAVFVFFSNQSYIFFFSSIGKQIKFHSKYNSSFHKLFKPLLRTSLGNWSLHSS